MAGHPIFSNDDEDGTASNIQLTQPAEKQEGSDRFNSASKKSHSDLSRSASMSLDMLGSLPADSNRLDLQQSEPKQRNKMKKKKCSEMPFIETITSESLETYLGLPERLFDQLASAEVRFNAASDSLQLMGEVMPKLRSLKINNSLVSCLRDIGTSMRSLVILSGSFCEIKDLSGISAFPSLKELYLSYNSISDLSPIMYNESIEVLDLEGNEIEKEQCIEDLATIKTLKYLTLLNNPIEKDESHFKELVARHLPYIQCVDDVPLSTIVAPVKGGLSTPGDTKGKSLEERGPLFNENSSILYELIDAGTKSEINLQFDKEPDNNDILLYAMKSRSQKLAAQAARSSQAAGQQGSDGPSGDRALDEDATSDLVHRATDIFYGNPLKAIKNKKNAIFKIRKIEEAEDEEQEEYLRLFGDMIQESDDQEHSNIVKLLNYFKVEDPKALADLEHELEKIEAPQVNMQKRGDRPAIPIIPKTLQSKITFKIKTQSGREQKENISQNCYRSSSVTKQRPAESCQPPVQPPKKNPE